jgi:hypothetical protein
LNFLLYIQPRIKALKASASTPASASRRYNKVRTMLLASSGNAHGSSPDVDLGNTNSNPELEETKENHGRSFARSDVAAMVDSSSS